MDKQTTLAFVLIGIVLMVWLYISTPTQPPVKKPAQTAQLQDTIKKQSVTAPIVSPVTPTISDDTSGNAKLFAKMKTAESIITIDNKVVRVEMTNKGGKIKKVYLKNFKNWFCAGEKTDNDIYRENIQLLNIDKGSSFDLAFVTGDGKMVNTKDLEFKSNVTQPNVTIKEGDSLVLAYEYATTDNRKIKKTYTFYGNRYDTHVDVEMNNIEPLVANDSYDLIWDAGIRSVEANSVDESNAANSSVYTAGEQVKIDAPHNGEKIEKDFNGKVDWLCIRNKYFAVVVSPDQPDAIEGAYVKGYAQKYADNGIKEFYSGRFKIPLKKPVQTNSFVVYTGPVDYSALKNFGRNFERIVDFGSFLGLSFIVRPIAEYVFLPLFKFLHSFIPNYGFVIIVFSLIIKLLLHPLTKQSYASMRKMQLLQPKMNEVKEKFKEDPTKMNKEVMKLYSTYGINPMGGCLPMILQMPVFVALWGLFQSSVELRQQPFIWWITDLSRPDIIAHLPFKIPIFGVDQISALALLMGVTTFVQQKMSIKDPQQQAMIYVMPVFLTVLFMSFPAGLNLYYFLFNLLSIGQQYYITHSSKGGELVPVKTTAKKKGFMEKMMEAAEEKSKTQTSKKKK